MSVAVVALNVDPWKPVWFDELCNFVFGGYRTTSDAVRAILDSIPNGTNHGQTGVYLLLDSWLLRGFGASAFWLRFPSLAAAVLLLLAGHVAFENWRLPAAWRAAGLAALLGQPFLLGFVREARTYLPLAACTVAALAYFTSRTDERRTLLVRSVGWVGVLGGALIHPYFMLYWFAAIVCGEVHRSPVSLRGLAARANVPLTATGLALYAGVGMATWMRGGPDFARGPFAVIGPGLKTVRALLSAHFGFLGVAKAPLLGVAALVVLAVLVTSRGTALRPLAEPMVVIGLALVLTLAVSYASYRANYWILQRQWIASAAFAALGWALLLQRLGPLLPPIARISVAGVFGAAIALQALTVGREDIARWIRGVTAPPPEVQAIPQDVEPTSAAAWIDVANANIREGGPVWPIFRRFIEREAEYRHRVGAAARPAPPSQTTR